MLPARGGAGEILPRPLWGEADARLRAAGEGPHLPKIPDVRRNRQPRRTNVPHHNPLPSWGEGTGAERARIPRATTERGLNTEKKGPLLFSLPFPLGKGP